MLSFPTLGLLTVSLTLDKCNTHLFCSSRIGIVRMIRVRHATMGDRAVVSSCGPRPVFDILSGCPFFLDRALASG
jgi:hypothetical protein